MEKILVHHGLFGDANNVGILKQHRCRQSISGDVVIFVAFLLRVHHDYSSKMTQESFAIGVDCGCEYDTYCRFLSLVLFIAYKVY